MTKKKVLQTDTFLTYKVKSLWIFTGIFTWRHENREYDF